MGRGPGVLNTVLKKKHQLFKALANMSEACGNSYTVVLAIRSGVYAVCAAHKLYPTYCYIVVTRHNTQTNFGKIPKYQI
jgi:hypothetical protein